MDTRKQVVDVLESINGAITNKAWFDHEKPIVHETLLRLLSNLSMCAMQTDTMDDQWALVYFKYLISSLDLPYDISIILRIHQTLATMVIARPDWVPLLRQLGYVDSLKDRVVTEVSSSSEQEKTDRYNLCLEEMRQLVEQLEEKENDKEKEKE
eukprot:TRINITY_DN15795_c0_g1_i1.p1 TRINITY_DN15795_c0_g1~~TRINITY_DN15795_c0_g1_i1.p1  ORF type:complete len:181 (-),score=62.03 TRINITY_DN15795_c0_g1_i1:10-471(-)